MNFFLRPRKESRKVEIGLARDAFSDGQIGSKLWLCRELEKALARTGTSRDAYTIWLLAGWQGLLPFLLFSRGNIAIHRLWLFDIDSDAVEKSQLVNEHWRLQNKFAARIQDVNQPILNVDRPNIVINTSCEHFTDQNWWRRIPAETIVVLQSTDMIHEEHVNTSCSAAELRESFIPWRRILFESELTFSYPEFTFTRFMVIGEKA